MVEFKEANIKEFRQMLKEKKEFLIWPDKVKLHFNGTFDIYSRVAYEEGEIDFEHSFRKEHLRAYVVKEGSKIIGYGFVSIYPNKSAQWASLSMKKGYEKKGIGKEFVNWINGELKQKGVRIANLIAHAGAIDFYAKKTDYKRRNSLRKFSKYFWKPPTPSVIFGWKPSKKVGNKKPRK